MEFLKHAELIDSGMLFPLGDNATAKLFLD